ncbi:porin [Caballeronia temeraria]|uniref:Porin n=1 Tax=Caballeronia temeraria TaxID=1777137 RepID=A0A158CQS7_9BURK|nr:hypothetical protein [Caballeronia temeraria]SAK84649.1 porin [Caballeronia temeraria]
MKTELISIAVLLGLSSAAAHAQFTVPHVGEVDSGLLYHDNVYRLKQSDFASDGWGIKSNEDIGCRCDVDFKSQSTFDTTRVLVSRCPAHEAIARIQRTSAVPISICVQLAVPIDSPPL